MRRRRIELGTVLAIILAGAAAFGARADQVPSATDPEDAIRYSQAAIGRQLGDYAFVDQDGRPVRLVDFRGKPLLVNLVYTSCGDVCPTVVETLSRAVGVAQQALGRDSFAVVTVGFDAARDKPARMKAFAESHGVDLPNWRFLSTDKDTAARMASDLGFIYDASARGFDHLAQTTVIDREGRVYRQIYGAEFKTPALVEPLKDLVFRRGARIAGIDSLLDRIRLFCTIYDPHRDRYRFSYAIFISIIGAALSLGGVGFVLVRAVVRLHRRETGGLPQ
jgi:protein SCO1/2